ncbi:MAG: YjjG family noncanonical pyrimidine nucleotidase [Pseudarcicella sp.]|nr:YjjG family noncanonical pyrimidine nucleotidase [Pseudarcicella sp.]
MKKYKHIFFDLDHTLWDHTLNSRIALEEAYLKFNLFEIGIPSPEIFCTQFNKVNYSLWSEYEKGLITQKELRDRRFVKLFEFIKTQAFDQYDELSDFYIQTSTQKPHLLPNTKAILEYLKPKYQLHIITNGFIEIQQIKLKNSEIHHYFKEIITSEHSGFKKPHPQMFSFALDLVNANASDCIMIGDTFETDVMGAEASGVDAIFYNSENRDQTKTEIPFLEINDLIELKNIL